MRSIAVLLLLLVAASASAEDECATSFAGRLADAQLAVIERDAFIAQYEKVRPALDWFEANCRFLEDIEIVVRKLDDRASFVCDPKAKGRPKNLTAELVLTYSTMPTVGSYQKHHGQNHRCAESDRAARIPLVVLDDLTVLEKMELMCFQSERPKCAGMAEKIAEARARGIK